MINIEGIKMSKKRTVYSAEFKTRLVLEVLKEEKTLNEIASANNINPKNLKNWKKIFLENAEVAMEPAKLANAVSRSEKFPEKL